MRFVPVLISALFLTGCGAAMAEEQLAAETATARIVVSWGEEEVIDGAFDLRDGTGVADSRIFTADAVYEPIEIQPTGSLAKRWLKSAREDSDPFFLEPIAGLPQELLAFLETAEKGEPVTEGEERGEPVTYYAATVRMEEFIATLPASARAELEEVYAEWEGVSFQLAVDSDGRFRRAEFAFGDYEDLQIEIFDYGIPVNAKAPDPRTVLSWEEYAKLLEAECERAKKEGRENEVPHCASCGAGEGEA
jgi:hypothetical protein